MQKSEKIYLCLDEKRQTVCKLYEVLFVPVEVGMIWWTERFGNGYKYIHELSIEDVLKPEVHHRPDIQEEGKVISKFGNSSNQKNLGLTLHWTKTFVNFWKGVLNQTTQPTQARMLGKTTHSGRCKCERFSPWWVDWGKHFSNVCFSRINGTCGSNNINRVGHLFIGICTGFNITFTQENDSDFI